MVTGEFFDRHFIRRTKTLLFLLLLMMLFWIDRPAMADLRPALRHVGNCSPTDSTNPVVGWAFSVANDMMITELGVFDNNGNGVVPDSRSGNIPAGTRDFCFC